MIKADQYVPLKIGFYWECPSCGAVHREDPKVFVVSPDDQQDWMLNCKGELIGPPLGPVQCCETKFGVEINGEQIQYDSL